MARPCEALNCLKNLLKVGGSITLNTFTAMIEGVREPSINVGLIDEKTFDDGIKALYRTTQTDGVFCYAFFKALGAKL